jgi:hypothetical protein
LDGAYLSALAALAGAIIGGVTSFATTWLTTTTQARAARLAAERSDRQDLYGRFMTELATLFAEALKSDKVDYAKLIGAFALKGRIELMSSGPVVEAADRALKFVVDLTMGPPRSDAEVRAMMDDRNVDVIGAFAKACRGELQALG